MPCGCGKSYIVNNYEYSNRRRKDKSFKSFITFLLVVLLMWIVIYCIILTYNNKKSENLQHSNASKDNLHGNVSTTTKTPSFYKNTTRNNNISSPNPDNIQPSTEPLDTLPDVLKSDTENPLVTTKTSTKIGVSTDLNNTPRTSKVNLDISTELNVDKLKPNIEETDTTNLNGFTTQRNSDGITGFSSNENVSEIILDFDTVTEYNNIKTTTVTVEQNTINNMLETNRDLSQNTISQTSVTEQENITIFTNTKIDTNFPTTTEANKITTQNTSNRVTEEPRKKSGKNMESYTAFNVDMTTIAATVQGTDPVTELLDEQTVSQSVDQITEFSNVQLYVKEDTSYVVHTEIPIQKTSLTTVTETETSSNYDNLVKRFRYNLLNPRSKPNYVEIITEPSTTLNDLKYITASNETETPLKYKATTTSEKITRVVDDKGSDRTTLHYNNKDIMTSIYNVLSNRNDVTTDTMEYQSVTEKVNNEQCTSPNCKDQASQILQLMDHSIDPCEDFYEFSCGGLKYVEDFKNSKHIDILLKVLYTFKGSDDMYLNNFRKFFNTCIKYESDYGYSIKLNQVLSTNIRDKNFTTLLSFLMLRQSTPLFDVQYGLVGGEEGYGLQILPPNSNYKTTGLKDWSLQSQIKKKCLDLDPSLKYQSEISLPSVYESYTRCKTKTFKKMAEDFILEKTKVPNNPIVKEFLSFFSKMINISEPTLQDAILHQKYTKIYVDDLNRKYPQIDWPYFFDIITDYTFNKSTPIYLYLENEYFEQIMDDLKDRILKTEKEVITSLKLYYQLELYQNVLVPQRNKEQFCMNQAIQLMPEIATQIFYKYSGVTADSFSSIKNIYAKIEDVFKELKLRFYCLIEVSKLEEVNKQIYKDSLEKLKLKLFSDEAEWNRYLHGSYERSYLQDDYLSNVFMFIENKRKETYKLRDDKEEFLFNKFLESQFSKVPELVPNTNLVVIPSIFLNKIHELENTPEYIVESFVKFHLSRAVALHLNDLGEKLKSGFHKSFINNLNSYLEDGDDVKMLKGQKITYKLEFSKWQKVVQLSERTRMADNIALDLVFRDIFIQNNRTFKELPWIQNEYSPEKQFFIIITQEYCEISTVPSLAQNFYETQNIPSPFRIDNMITNSRVFGKTFQCPQGTKMNPEYKTQFDDFAPENDFDIEY